VLTCDPRACLLTVGPSFRLPRCQYHLGSCCQRRVRARWKISWETDDLSALARASAII
jgi:hypothetical protein